MVPWAAECVFNGIEASCMITLDECRELLGLPPLIRGTEYLLLKVHDVPNPPKTVTRFEA